MDREKVKGYKCVCPTGYALKENSTTECADEIAQYLVYNPVNGIQTVSLDTNFLTPIKGPPNMSFKVRDDIELHLLSLSVSLLLVQVSLHLVSVSLLLHA